MSGPSLSVSFVYDGDGRRVVQTINGETTYFVGNYYEQTGSTIRKYYYAGSQRVATKVGSTVYYLLTDHLGSTSLTTDAGGNVVSEMRYTAWGEVRYASGSTPTEYTFTGQYSNAQDFGLLFYNARWYDSSISHFAQADTLIPGAGNPQAWDRYGYALNDPVRFIDPTGHKACDDEYGDCQVHPPKKMKPPTPPILPDNEAGINHSSIGNGELMTSNGPCVGQAVSVGNYVGGYCAGQGGLDSFVLSRIIPDGECVQGVFALAGGSVPLRYGASYDVSVFDNLLIIFLHEQYWFPATDLPLVDHSTFGGSILITTSNTGIQNNFNLGDFAPGSIARPDELENRDTQIDFWGYENFPTQIWIKIITGADNMGAQTFSYQLNPPFLPH